MVKKPAPRRIEVGIRQLKNQLSLYIDEVQDGNEIIVTEHGKPVARLTTISDSDTRIQKLIDSGLVTPAIDPSRPRPRGRIPVKQSISELIREMREE